MPWVFLTLMLANIVYFGWKFMEGTQPQLRTAERVVVQEGDRLQLLTERREVVVAEPEPQEEVPVPEVAAPAPQCFMVGPLPDAQVEAVAGRLKAKGFAVRNDQRKAKVKDYWVFLPAFTNRARAEERLRELRERGIESFIVTEGRFINAISLGHFSRRELAEAFRDKMLSVGVMAEFRELDVDVVERWLFVSPAGSRQDVRAIIEQEIARNRDLRRESAACEE